jgi:hypothetical protein
MENVTLAMSCENDEESVQPRRPLNWLECKKAVKARLIAVPNEREKLTEELENCLAEPYEAEDSNPYMWWVSNHQASYISEFCAGCKIIP